MVDALQTTPLARQIEAKAQELVNENPQWLAGVLPDKAPSNWRWPSELTQVEAAVFAINPAAWPRSVAALHAYESFMEGCPDEAYAQARQDCPAIYRAEYEAVETFAEFAHVFAKLDASDAYAAWYKHKAWEFREGHRYLIRLSHHPRDANTADTGGSWRTSAVDRGCCRCCGGSGLSWGRPCVHCDGSGEDAMFIRLEGPSRLCRALASGAHAVGLLLGCASGAANRCRSYLLGWR